MSLIMEDIPCKKYYMDIQLDFGEENQNEAVEMDANKFKYTIGLALKILHGEMGSIIPIDVLKYREHDRRAFIRVPAKDLDTVWSSLTLFSRYDGLECAFRIFKVTPILCCLMFNSRLYKHKEAEDCSEIHTN